MIKIKYTVILFLLTLLFPLSAHEFWIEPIRFSVEQGEEVFAHEKVGQDFKGNEYAYLPSSYVSFNITENNKTRAVTSRIGDRPAVSEKTTEAGLIILSAETTASELIYEKAEKFNEFLENDGLEWVKKQHKKRGLPDKGFVESYRRLAKSVIKVGHGEGHDRIMGLPIEWILETNPYTDSGSMTAQLLWQGKPLPNKKVNVFNRIFDKGSTLIENTRLLKRAYTTDLQGRVVIPRGEGGLFLINAVHMIEPSEKEISETGAVWESLWASMTYKIYKIK